MQENDTPEPGWAKTPPSVADVEFQVSSFEFLFTVSSVSVSKGLLETFPC
jgi:hypothetical protein